MSGTLEEPKLGTNIAFIWAALNFGCWLYVFLFIPELRSLELEAVDEMYTFKALITNIVVSKRRSPLGEQHDGCPVFPTRKMVRNSRILIQMIPKIRELLSLSESLRSRRCKRKNRPKNVFVEIYTPISSRSDNLQMMIMFTIKTIFLILNTINNP
jgi:hypothetical protein